ncbi:MAG TPA: DUF4920 domain-containing protein [Rubricoccaceae bacterium]
MDRLTLVAFGALSLSACSGTPATPPAPAGPISVQSQPERIGGVEQTEGSPDLYVGTAPRDQRTWMVGDDPNLTAGEVLSVDDALAQSASLDGQTVRVAGTIRQVCQARGCWLTFSTAQGQTLRVVTHDEGEEDREDLLFPMDASGRHAEVVGRLVVTEESVERRRHLAEDGGATPEAIAAITEPSRAVSLVATGARIAAAPPSAPAGR